MTTVHPAILALAERLQADVDRHRAEHPGTPVRLEYLVALHVAPHGSKVAVNVEPFMPKPRPGVR